MERAKLIVKNFGPLKDIDIEVREMVTFIGAQASGKSTLAKLLSIFEDESFRRDDTISFEDELKKYNILSYLKKDTIINYSNNKIGESPFEFSFKENNFEKNNILFTLSIVKDFKDTLGEQLVENFKDLLVTHLNLHYLIYRKEFLQIFKTLEQQNEFRKIIVNKRKYQKISSNEINNIFEILGEELTHETLINLFENIFKIFPDIYLFDSIYIPSERNFLHLIKENALGLLNNDVNIPKHLLITGQEYEKAIQSIKELPLTIIDKKFKYKREGKTSYIYHNKNEKVDLLESASGLQSIIPILLLVEYSKSLKEKYNFNFVVEEPELNLYPKAQHELIKYLVKNCLFERKNLILTTHSPFVLASINNLLLAYDKGQKNPKEVNKIIKKDSWLNPKNFIAYELKNGKAKKIMNDKLGQIAENMIDSVSDTFAEEFDKLLDL